MVSLVLAYLQLHKKLHFSISAVFEMTQCIHQKPISQALRCPTTLKLRSLWRVT